MKEGPSNVTNNVGHRRDLSLTSFQSDFGAAKRLVTELRLEGTKLWMGRIRGLVTKRITYASRRWILFAVLVTHLRASFGALIQS